MEILKGIIFLKSLFMPHSGDGARKKYTGTNMKEKKQPDLACADPLIGAAQGVNDTSSLMSLDNLTVCSIDTVVMLCSL